MARRQRGGLEHQVIAVLAGDGGAMTPRQVRDVLGAQLAYTTVMTVLARLYDKGLVGRRRAGRSFVYQAVTDEDEVAARRMQRHSTPGASTWPRCPGSSGPSPPRTNACWASCCAGRGEPTTKVSPDDHLPGCLLPWSLLRVRSHVGQHSARASACGPCAAGVPAGWPIASAGRA